MTAILPHRQKCRTPGGDSASVDATSEITFIWIGTDMGNRTNFVIVKDQDWQLFYSHWAGCRILDALIGGPELALRYARSLRPCAKDEWVDRYGLTAAQWWISILAGCCSSVTS